MARADKLIEANVQIQPFVPRLVDWLISAIEKGKTVRITAITDDEPDFDTNKSDIQREKFHAMIGDIHKTGVIVIPGKRIVLSEYTFEKCKAMCVMWFANEMREMGTPIPNPPENFDCPLTGQVISIRPSTRQWGKKLTCVFVDWLYATGAIAGVKWSEKALEEYQTYREAQK